MSPTGEPCFKPNSVSKAEAQKQTNGDSPSNIFFLTLNLTCFRIILNIGLVHYLKLEVIFKTAVYRYSRNVSASEVSPQASRNIPASLTSGGATVHLPSLSPWTLVRSVVTCGVCAVMASSAQTPHPPSLGHPRTECGPAHCTRLQLVPKRRGTGFSLWDPPSRGRIFSTGTGLGQRTAIDCFPGGVVCSKST